MAVIYQRLFKISSCIPLGVCDAFQKALPWLRLAQNIPFPLGVFPPCKLHFLSEIGAVLPLLKIQGFSNLFSILLTMQVFQPHNQVLEGFTSGWVTSLCQQKAPRQTHTSPTTTALSFSPHQPRQILRARTTYH